MARAAETAYAVIRAGILSGTFERGSRLREEQVAESAGVSRTPVREALRRLDAEGLVEFTPNRGARVTAWTGQALSDLYELRALLESYGARLAATRITPNQLAEIEGLAEQMSALIDADVLDVDKLTCLNSTFHGRIISASASPQLDSVIRGVVDAPLVFQAFSHYSPERLRSSNTDHVNLVAAMRTGEAAWAAATMQAHILAARSTVIAAVAGQFDG